MDASQQLGAVPRENRGNDGIEPEGNDDLDGAEFASSGEAEQAPRGDEDDFDIELTDDVLERIRAADLTAREAADLLLQPDSGDFGTNLTERVNAGSGEEISAQAQA